MSSIQALKDKRDSRQREYNVAATRLEKLREQKGFETDVSERFKLDNQIQQVEADLERLGHEIDSLDEKIQAVESGQIKVDEVLKQEGLKPTAQSPQLLKPLAAVGAVIFIGLIGVQALNGRSGNSDSNSNTEAASVEPPASPAPAGLDSRFAGKWTTEGDHSTLYLMNMNIETQPDTLSGLLTSQKRGGPESGELSVSGTGQGDTANVTIYAHNVPTDDGQITQAVWQAELKLEGENLVWRSPQGSNDFFPAVVTLFKVP